MNDSKKIPLLEKCIIAVRAFSFTATVTSVALGISLSYYEGHPVLWGRFLLTLLGVICFHTAANLINDCFDHKRGLDKNVNPTSGAVVRGWITEQQAFRTAILLLVIGCACGLLLAYLTGWIIVLSLGVIGTIIALGYTRNGFCLKYAGMGDLAIFAAFGVLPVFGTYWVQAESFSWLPILWSIPLVSYTVGILHANNWRDINTDPNKNCRTMATILGERLSGTYYKLLMIGPFVLVGLYLAAGLIKSIPTIAPLTVLAVLLVLPLAIKLAKTKKEGNEKFCMLDGMTAQIQLMFGILLTIAFATAHLLK